MQKVPKLSEKEDRRLTDERNNAGVIAPPPLIYLVSLVVGLLLKRKFPIASCRAGRRACQGYQQQRGVSGN
jgi:hypothetical protein